MPAIHIELQATAFDVAQSKYSPKKALEYQTTITDLAKQSILNEARDFFIQEKRAALIGLNKKKFLF